MSLTSHTLEARIARLEDLKRRAAELEARVVVLEEREANRSAIIQHMIKHRIKQSIKRKLTGRKP